MAEDAENTIRMHLNERGFAIGEFKDTYGTRCTIQESSLASRPALWLGVQPAEAKVMSVDAKGLPPPKIVPDEGSGEDFGWSNYVLPDKVFVFSRMHLDIPLAKKLVRMLNYFIKHGELPKRGNGATSKSTKEGRKG